MEGLSSVDRALDVLFHLHREPEPRGVTAIGRAVGLPKSTTHRLLQVLSRWSVVEQDARGRYRPGLGLVALGLGALDREPIVAAARPVLEAEAEALAETAFLVGARAGSLVVLDKVEGKGFLRAAPRVGSTVPAHATAVGKLYLAYAPASVRSDSRERFTARTAVSDAALSVVIEQTRAQGFGVNDEEWIEGLSVVAAPVLCGEILHGAIAVAAATGRMNKLGTRRIGARCVAAAQRVAANLKGGRA